MAKKDKLIPMTFRVNESLATRLDELAENMDLDRAEVARRALRNGIGELETITRVATNPVAEKLLQLGALFEMDPEERAEMLRVIRAMADSKKTKRLAKKGVKPA